MTAPLKTDPDTAPKRVTSTQPVARTAPRTDIMTNSEWLALVRARLINSVAATAQSRQLPCAADRSVIPEIYGADRVGAEVLNVVPSGSNVLVQCLWATASDSVNDVKYNELDLPAGSSTAHYPNGGLDSAFVAAMAAAGVAYTDTLVGYCYSIITMPQKDFTGSLSFTARIKGRKVHESRYNAVKNFTGIGVNGGTTPGTYNSINGFSGGSATIVGQGVEDGIPYLDFSIVGTASPAGAPFVGFNWYGLSQAYVSALSVQGQTWGSGAFVKLVSGTFPASCYLNGSVLAVNSSGVYVDQVGVWTHTTGAIPPFSTPLRQAGTTVNSGGFSSTGALVAATAYGVGMNVGVHVPNGVAINCVIRIGLPRLWHSSWGDPYRWSDVPALCLADFIMRYGESDVYWPSVGTTADANDEIVGGSARRKINIAFINKATVPAIAETMRTYAGCFLVYSKDGIKFIPDKAGSVVATYAHDSGQIAQIVRLEKRDSGDVPTVVEVVYTDTAAIPWRDGSAFESVAGVDVTVPRRESTVALPGIQSYSQAYREAIERLNKLQVSDLSLTLDVFDQGIAHEEGDIIAVTHPIGLTSKQMRVGDIDALGNGLWRLTCAEYDPAAYTNAVATGPTYPDTLLTNPAVPPSTVTGFASVMGDTGLALTWNRNPELSVTEYELRKGGAWLGGTPLFGSSATIVGGTILSTPPLAPGSYTLWIKARTVVGVESTNAASIAVTITAPGVTSLASSFIGTDVQLSWALSAGSFALAEYEVRYGTDWSSSAATAVKVKATAYRIKALWSGTRTWWVAAIDVNGNVGTPVSTTATVNQLAAPSGLRADIVDNNVLLYWSAVSANPLPVDRYEVRKGAGSFLSQELIGSNADSTFCAIFETQAGSYTYQVAAYDSAGNLGAVSSLVAEVKTPPDFQLLRNAISTYTGTKTNAIVDGSNLLMPFASSETWATHFTNNSQTTIAGLDGTWDYYFEPIPGAGGSYEEVVDALNGSSGSIAQAVVRINPSVGQSWGTPTLSYNIQVSNTSSTGPWTDLGNVQESLASSFRWVKYKVSCNGSGAVRITSLSLTVSLKQKDMAGRINCVSTDTGGTVVYLTADGTSGGTKVFLDVESITVTPEGTTALIAVFDFTDTPSPLSFKILLFNTSGVRQTGYVRWAARGV